jgi:hypothetical protein
LLLHSKIIKQITGNLLSKIRIDFNRPKGLDLPKDLISTEIVKETVINDNYRKREMP